MSYIQNLYTSRDNNAQGNTYVGQSGRLWWNPDTNAFYYSDGSTAGGIPVGTASSNSLPGGPAYSVQLNSGSNSFSGSGNLTFNNNNLSLTGNIIVSGNISPAAVGKIGGIQPGPGVNISNVGLLTIDSSNVPFSFGDFYANAGTLSLVNADENMILETQGNATIQLIGNIGFYQADGSSPSGQYFSATNDGIVSISVTNTGTQGAFNIIGSTTGNEISPGQTGAMMHVTGQLGIPDRIYFDGNDSYVSIVGRRWNGNVTMPTQVLAGEDVLRINATAATTTGVGNVATAQISFQALENQTPTAQGSQIIFTATGIGSNASSRVAVANITVANGVTATKFNTTGNINAANGIFSSNVSTSNLTVSDKTNLGGVANITITGGTANYFMRTDGTGNLTWAPISATPVTNVAANANSYTIDFTDNSLILLYQPTGTVNLTLTNYTAGKSARVMVRFGATNYVINTGLLSGAQSTEGLTAIPISGGGGHNTKANATVQLLYTCFDNTAGNCYMAATYF